MENKDLRREKLKAIIAGFRTLKDCGEALGVEPVVLSQLKNGHRNVGQAIARRIEAKLGKPRGWMDTPDDPTASMLAALGADKMLLQLIDIYNELSPQQKHELVAHANTLLADNIKTPTAAAPFAGVIKKVKA
jgi:hypothetical protein